MWMWFFFLSGKKNYSLKAYFGGFASNRKKNHDIVNVDISRFSPRDIPIIRIDDEIRFG